MDEQGMRANDLAKSLEMSEAQLSRLRNHHLPNKHTLARIIQQFPTLQQSHLLAAWLVDQLPAELRNSVQVRPLGQANDECLRRPPSTPAELREALNKLTARGGR